MAFNIFTFSKSGNEEQKIYSELKEIKQALDIAHMNFNNSCDSDLVEANIYKINSLNSQYKYLIKIARERNYKFDSVTTYNKAKEG